MVSAAFSDAGGLFYYRIVDVQPDGQDLVIRYSRIGWTDFRFCPRKIVQSARARLRNRTIKDLVHANNPCAVKPQDLAAAVKRYSTAASFLDTFSVGVVATCGPTKSVLELPDGSFFNFKRLKSANPVMGRLWNLMSDIVNPAFGEGDIFQERTEAEDLVLQRAGQEIVPELASGRYDEGLAAAMRGNDSTWQHPSMRELLKDYRGPVTNAEVKAKALSAILLNAEQYRFSAFAKPEYPLVAANARIQGDVNMQLTVDPATGDVTSAEALSGYKILQDNAAATTKKWRFEPNSVGAGQIGVTLRYTLSCQ